MDSALSSPSHESQSYHFASQNVFLTNPNPTHFGIAGSDRILIVYESLGLLEIHRFYNRVDARLKKAKDDNLDEENQEVFAIDEEIDKEEFILERRIPLHDVDIMQVVHCPIVPEYFALLINNRTRKLRSVRAYSNHLLNENETTFITRFNGELINSISANYEFELPKQMENIDSQLNIIEFQHADILLLANYIHSCPVSGNFVISNANGTILMYRYTRCILPTNKHHVAIDFVLVKTIVILDGWIPEMVKLSLTYIAIMGQTHFSLIQIVLTDQPEYENGHHQLEYDYDSKYKVSEEKHIIYNRLFDEVLPPDSIFGINSKSRIQNHADSVWGPVDESMSCKFTIYDNAGGKTKESPCNVLFCRNLSVQRPRRPRPNASSLEKPKFYPNELLTLRGKSKLCAEQIANASTDSKLFFFGMDLLPIRDRNGLIFAQALYLLWANQLHCYLIDLRRDKLRLVPISKLDFTDLCLKSTPLEGHSSSVVIRDFSANPQEDLVHILTDSSFDTYSTQMFNFLVSERAENMYCSRPIADLYPISTHIFFNLIATLSSTEFVFLVSSEESARHTIYNLRRPSLDHLQADLVSTIDDIKSNSDDSTNPNNNHSLHRLYLQLHSIAKFAVLFPTRSNSFGGGGGPYGSTRQERLEAFHQKIYSEIEAILAENPTCDHPNCPFVNGAFRK